MDGDDLARLAFLGILVVAIAGSLIVQSRAHMARTLQYAALWALIFLGTVAVVGLWPDIRNSIAPRQSVIQTAGVESVEVPRGADGHYRLTLQVNGAPVLFYVDTGATDVVLSRRDAVAAGIDVETLNFLGEAQTANGTVRTARIWLDEVALEGNVDAGVPAVVTEGALDISLLGMSYLGRFARIEIAGDRLILTR